MKRIFALCMVILLLLLTSVSCRKDSDVLSSSGAESSASDSDKEEKKDDTDTSDTEPSPDDNISSQPSGTTSSSTTSTTPQIEDKKYGGKSFVMYYWYQPDAYTNDKVAAFNKAHDAKVEIKVVSGDFTENIATSVATGKPYDIIANHSQYFPCKNLKGILEPLNSYIVDSDYLKSSNAQYGGLSKTAVEHFTYGGKIYAVGSNRSVSPYAFFYNKAELKLYTDADPYALWKSGKWTWEEFKKISKAVGGSQPGLLSNINLNVWLAVCGADPVVRSGDNYTLNFNSGDFKSALNSYRELYYGQNPIIATKAPSFNIAVANGSTPCTISAISSYIQYAETIKNASDRNLRGKYDNIGIVPLPSGLYKNGKYPTVASQGYSSAKGAADPSIAVCYAIFDSRAEYTGGAAKDYVPAEIYNAIYNELEKGVYMPFVGFSDSDTSMLTLVNRMMGNSIKNGEAVDDVINTNKGTANGIINDVMSKVK